MTTATSTATERLLNPASYDGAEFDAATRRLFRATIDWFEAKGKTAVMAETRSDEWYGDFIEFLERERAFGVAHRLVSRPDAAAALKLGGAGLQLEAAHLLVGQRGLGERVVLAAGQQTPEQTRELAS